MEWEAEGGREPREMRPEWEASILAQQALNNRTVGTVAGVGQRLTPGKSRHAGCLSQTGGAGCHEGAATPVLGFGRAPGLPRGEHPAPHVGAFAHVHASAYLPLVLKIPQSPNPAKFQP